MRNLMFFLMIVQSTVTVFAQSDSLNIGWIAASVGPAFPISYFARKNAKSEKSGLAERGLQFTFTSNIKLYYNAGIYFQNSYARNSIDGSEILDMYSTKWPELSWRLSTYNWRSHFLLIGPSYSFSLKQIDLLFRLTAGYGLFSSPLVGISGGNGGNDYIIVEQLEANDGELCLGTGFQLNLRISQRMSLVVDGCYLYSEPDFLITGSASVKAPYYIIDPYNISDCNS